MEWTEIKIRKDPNTRADHRADRLRVVLWRRVGRGAARGRRLDHHRPRTEELIDVEKPIFLVDVREPAEWEIVRIPGATLIPKDEILRGDALASLPQDRQIVMYCKTGVRSAETLAAVKNAGFADAVHVQGGVTAWVKQVDPEPAVLLGRSTPGSGGIRAPTRPG